MLIKNTLYKVKRYSGNIFSCSCKYIVFFIQLWFMFKPIAGKILKLPLSFLLDLLQFIHCKMNFIYPDCIVLSYPQANYCVHLHCQSPRANSPLLLNLFLCMCIRKPRNLSMALTVYRV